MPALSARLIGAVHHIVRAEKRLPVLWNARLCIGEVEIKASLRNVSASGFMGLVPTQIQAGSEVILRLPIGVPLIADVRWSHNDRIGCRLRGRFDIRQRAFLTLCGLFSGSGVQALIALGAIAIVSFV